jgi:DNA-binding transcriptional ArsR family regulator
MNRFSPLELMFSSKCSVRIMAALLEREELNVSELVRLTGMSHKSVIESAEKLSALGVIKEKRFGRIRIYQLEKNKEVVVLVFKLNEELSKLWTGSRRQST